MYEGNKVKSDVEIYVYIERIEDMLNDENYRWNWAESTLSGILHFIKERGKITDEQMRAVDNIFNSVRK